MYLKLWWWWWWWWWWSIIIIAWSYFLRRGLLGLDYPCLSVFFFISNRQVKRSLHFCLFHCLWSQPIAFRTKNTHCFETVCGFWVKRSHPNLCVIVYNFGSNFLGPSPVSCTCCLKIPSYCSLISGYEAT